MPSADRYQNHEYLLGAWPVPGNYHESIPAAVRSCLWSCAPEINQNFVSRIDFSDRKRRGRVKREARNWIALWIVYDSRWWPMIDRLGQWLMSFSNEVSCEKTWLFSFSFFRVFKTMPVSKSQPVNICFKAKLTALNKSISIVC